VLANSRKKRSMELTLAGEEGATVEETGCPGASSWLVHESGKGGFWRGGGEGHKVAKGN